LLGKGGAAGFRRAASAWFEKRMVPGNWLPVSEEKMKTIILIFIGLTCGSAFAEEPKAGNELTLALVKNREEMKRGTNDFDRFLPTVKRIADDGDPVAQFIYGTFMAATNKKLSMRYLTLSSEKGCAGATAMLGVVSMVLKDYERAVNYFKQAAIKGDAGAQAGLAGFYMRGEHGFPKDISMALAWAKLAERQIYSIGSLDAIRQYLKEIKSSATQDEIKRGENIFSELSVKYPKKAYYMCGQSNVDTSREPEIVNLIGPIVN
jgi:TPR repeat protein